MPEPFAARYESECPACKEKIHVGQMIERWGASFRHSGCIALPGVRPPMTGEEYLEWADRRDEAKRDEELIGAALRRYMGSRVDPGDFDFPCSRVWRCYYSDEPYYPDAEEVRRAEQLEADLAINERTHNSLDPFKAALEAMGINIAPPSYAGAWIDIVLQGGIKKGLRPLNE